MGILVVFFSIFVGCYFCGGFFVFLWCCVGGIFVVVFFCVFVGVNFG